MPGLLPGIDGRTVAMKSVNEICVAVFGDANVMFIMLISFNTT